MQLLLLQFCWSHRVLHNALKWRIEGFTEQVAEYTGFCMPQRIGTRTGVGKMQPRGEFWPSWLDLASRRVPVNWLDLGRGCLHTAPHEAKPLLLLPEAASAMLPHIPTHNPGQSAQVPGGSAPIAASASWVLVNFPHLQKFSSSSCPCYATLGMRQCGEAWLHMPGTMGIYTHAACLLQWVLISRI